MRVVDRQDIELDVTEDATSAALGLDHMEGFAVTVAVDNVGPGALDGTFTLEVTSSDPFTDNVTLEANPDAAWTTFTGSSQSVSLSEDEQEVYVWNAESVYYRGVRLVWTPEASASGATGSSYVVDWFAKGTQS